MRITVNLLPKSRNIPMRPSTMVAVVVLVIGGALMVTALYRLSVREEEEKVRCATAGGTYVVQRYSSNVCFAPGVVLP